MSFAPLPPLRLAPVLILVGLVISLVVVLVVSQGGTEDGADPPTAPAATTPAPEEPPSVLLADYDTASLTVQRAAFCDLVSPESLEAALGGPSGKLRSYGNGESTAITPDLTDIAAEFGCRWQRGGTTLHAWVFAPPVTPAEATGLVADARKRAGCDVRRGAAAFGEPTLARTCPVGKGYEASYRGLFGDAWLTCAMTTPGARGAVLKQTGAWCRAVAEAASQPPA